MNTPGTDNELFKEENSLTTASKVEANETETAGEPVATTEPDNVLPEKNAGKTTEDTPVLVEEEVIVADNEAPGENLATDLSKEELIQKMKEVLQLPDVDKNEIESIKQAFYKKHKAEQNEWQKKFIEDGGEFENFEPKKDPLEEELKKLLADYRHKKAEQNLKLQHEKEHNLNEKLKIIEKLKTLTDDLDAVENVSETITTVRNLQQEWKNTGQVPPEKSNELWKNYQLYIEKFYDYIKINNELREYDLKKNLELKTALCEQAEKLAEAEDIQTAFRVLQTLHEEWKETGPVVRELREEIWERLKNASTVINKKHQTHFEAKKEEEEKNLAGKTAFCEQVENINYEILKTYKDWEDQTKAIIEIQAAWKQTGFAPKKANAKIYERFRKACDMFFERKNEYFLSAKNELNENLNKKIKLCEQAEALKGNTDWKETSDKLIKLQKEWKTIGPVPRKQSDAVWKRFISACDYFFEQKLKNTAEERQEQDKNLELKKEIITSIENLDISNPQEAVQQLKSLIAEWGAIGFVPFKEKDKVYKAFKKAADAMFDSLKVDEHNRRLHLFKANIEELSDRSSQHKLFRERDKLKKELEFLSNEISTYENNIGFFSSSKKADKLIKDMEKKIEKLKDEKELILKKINLIENSL